jgi:hypothetical protein
MNKVKQLNKLATEMVGDGGKTNVFFVSLAGNIRMITTDFHEAYEYWKSFNTILYSNVETALEDRKWGTICDRSPNELNNGKLMTLDESEKFLKQYPRHRCY